MKDYLHNPERMVQHLGTDTGESLYYTEPESSRRESWSQRKRGHRTEAGTVEECRQCHEGNRGETPPL